MGVRVENRSEWPDWLVRWVVRRACSDAGVKVYRWTQVRRSRPRFSGEGWGARGRGGCNRRGVKTARAWQRLADRRTPGCVEWIPMSPVADLAFLIRHEVAHARGAEGDIGAREFRRGGLHDMEDACNEAAGRFVRALAADWPAVLAEWRAIARRERERARPAVVDRTQATRDKHAASLDAWQRKLKLAQTKVRKYRALMNAADRRLAARPAPKGDCGAEATEGAV